MRNDATIFEYDTEQPLDVQSKVIETSRHAVLYDTSFASVNGTRVAAYLVVPRGPGPFAGILFGHWGNGTRAQFISEAKLYAKGGAVSLIPDYPWERSHPWRRTINNFDRPEADRETFIQTVIDLRRGIDLLRAHPAVDSDRVAYVGHSYGAQWGAILRAIDKRFRTVILMAGVPAISDYLMGNTHPDVVEQRQSQPIGRLERYVEVMGELDAIHFIEHGANTPLLLQFARYEQYFDGAAARRYIEAAGEPGETIWYETDHGLNAVECFGDRHRWLGRFIALRGNGRP